MSEQFKLPLPDYELWSKCEEWSLWDAIHLVYNIEPYPGNWVMDYQNIKTYRKKADKILKLVWKLGDRALDAMRKGELEAEHDGDYTINNAGEKEVDEDDLQSYDVKSKDFLYWCRHNKPHTPDPPRWLYVNVCIYGKDRPDFTYWGALARWTLEQAALCICGIKPSEDRVKELKSLPATHEPRSIQEAIYLHVQNAIKAGELKDHTDREELRIEPPEFIRWAAKRTIYYSDYDTYPKLIIPPAFEYFLKDEGLPNKLEPETVREQPEPKPTPSQEGKYRHPPLTPQEEAVLQVIQSQPPGKGIIGRKIIDILQNEKDIEIEQSSLTSRIIPSLKKHYPIKNRLRVGYYLDSQQ